MIEQELKQAQDCLNTFGDWLRFATSLFNRHQVFFGHGTDNAWDEAAALLLQALDLPIDTQLGQVRDSTLLPLEKHKLVDWLRQRIVDRRPLPYLSKKAWFAGLEFFVDDRVLIPRSPIAENIQRRFEPWLAGRPVERILDLCTGSGCLAIASALSFPEAMVDAVDISPSALEVAAINVAHYGLEDQVELVQSDLFKDLQGRRYDLIISNPPYVGDEEMSSLPEEFQHEPELALASGFDGLSAVREMLREASQHLSERGLIIVEVGNTQATLEEAFPDVPFTWLDYEQGGEGVFMLTAAQLRQYRHFF